MNIAHEYVAALGKDVVGCREEYDGACIDFAGDFVDSHPGARLAYFDNLYNTRWRYHAAPVIGMMVHDLWEDEAILLAPYMQRIGAMTVEFPAE